MMCESYQKKTKWKQSNKEIDCQKKNRLPKNIGKKEGFSSFPLQQLIKLTLTNTKI